MSVKQFGQELRLARWYGRRRFHPGLQEALGSRRFRQQRRRIWGQQERPWRMTTAALWARLYWRRWLELRGHERRAGA